MPAEGLQPPDGTSGAPPCPITAEFCDYCCLPVHILNSEFFRIMREEGLHGRRAFSIDVNSGPMLQRMALRSLHNVCGFLLGWILHGIPH